MVGMSPETSFPKMKGDSMACQIRAQMHCDFRFSQIKKNLKSEFCNYKATLFFFLFFLSYWHDQTLIITPGSAMDKKVAVSWAKFHPALKQIKGIWSLKWGYSKTHLTELYLAGLSYCSDVFFLALQNSKLSVKWCLYFIPFY